MTPIEYSVDYTRRVFKLILEWYKSAENKAQIFLTLNGLSLGFLGGNYMFNADSITFISELSCLEIILMIFVLIFISGSIILAMLCIWSRFVKFNILDNAIFENPKNVTAYDIKFLNFFDHLRKVNPKTLHKQLLSFSENNEIEVLADQIVILSKIVKAKHKLVNGSIVLYSLSLISYICLLALMIAY